MNQAEPTIQIKIRNLSKKFDQQPVLDHLNLDVYDNEAVVILGKSGAGKSVLLKHIIGITKPDEGSIDIAGIRISELSGPRLYESILHMGMLFQGGALFDSMNVEENVAFFLHQHSKTLPKISSSEIEQRVKETLDWVGLSGTEKKMPSELSGGMRKRAGLARLIISRPSIILYDEPTTGLDPITAMQINQLILKIQKELRAISIIVTHDILSALYVADRLALIENGAIAHIAPVEDFMQIDHPMIAFLDKAIGKSARAIKELHV